MLKKSVLALFGLVFAMALITPPKANAEVVIGVGVGARPAYGYVVARPHAYGYIAPAPYVAYGPVMFTRQWFIREMVWPVWGTRGRMPTDMQDGVATVGGVKTSAIYFLSPSVRQTEGFHCLEVDATSRRRDEEPESRKPERQFLLTSAPPQQTLSSRRAEQLKS